MSPSNYQRAMGTVIGLENLGVVAIGYDIGFHCGIESQSYMILVELHGGGLHVRAELLRWQHSPAVRQQLPLQAPHECCVL